MPYIHVRASVSWPGSTMERIRFRHVRSMNRIICGVERTRAPSLPKNRIALSLPTSTTSSRLAPIWYSAIVYVPILALAILLLDKPGDGSFKGEKYVRKKYRCFRHLSYTGSRGRGCRRSPARSLQEHRYLRALPGQYRDERF